MSRRATATKQAIFLFGAPSLLAMGGAAAIGGSEVVLGFMAGSGITTLGLGQTVVPVAGGAAAALANPRTVQVLNTAGTVLSNFSRFVSKVPANAKSSALMEKLENGTYRFTATSAGNVPGSRAIYEKTVDAAGRTIGYIKTTIAPDGSIVHIKDKFQ